MVSYLWSGNIGIYEFLTGQNVLAEKGLVEKAATVKRFECSPWVSELKKQTSIAEKQFQRSDSGDEALKIKKDDKASPIKKHNFVT